MKYTKTSVIIGRFQSDELTEGHKHLIDAVKKKRKGAQLVVILSKPYFSYTSKNPLPLFLVAEMIKYHYPSVLIYFVRDNPSDKKWSEAVDRVLALDKNVVLYGSRDSFINHYHGKHKCVEIKQLLGISATQRRKDLGEMYKHTSNFRAGIIHAVENRFPTAYATVDIAVLKINVYPYPEGRLQLLLGRKFGSDKFVFFGGFVDPSDTCLESAAARELSEEVDGLITHELKYIYSHKIDDIRYKGTKDGIMTSLFVTYKLGGNERPGVDEMEEVRWFPLKKTTKDVLHPHHHILYDSLINYLKL